MSKNLIDLRDLRRVNVAGAYVVQWFPNYFDQNEASAFVLAGLEDGQWSPDRVGDYNDLHRKGRRPSEEEDSFRDFVRYNLPFSRNAPSDKQDLMRLKEYPEIRHAYLQDLLRHEFESYISSKGKDNLSNLLGDDLVAFLMPPKIRKQYFDPVFKLDFYGDPMCDDLGLDYDQFVREYVLLNSTPLDKLWRIVRSTPIRISPFLETVLDLAEKKDFSPSALVVKKLNVGDSSTIEQDESGEAFFFPPSISPIIDWVKDLLTKTSLSPDEISTLLSIVEDNEYNLDDFHDELVNLFSTGTNLSFPKLLAQALSREPELKDFMKICENHWDDCLLSALLACNVRYPDYPPEIQQEFFRMCQVAGMKAEPRHRFRSRFPNYEAGIYEDDPIVKLDRQSCIEGIVFDDEVNFEYRVYASPKNTDEDIDASDIINPDFCETQETFKGALDQAVMAEQERRQNIQNRFADDPEAQRKALSSEPRVHISIKPIKGKKENSPAS